MKSKKHLLFLLLTISFVLFMMVFMRLDSDYLWHFKAGEYMFFNHSILTHDVFSWTVPGSYWMSHEWGFELIIYIMSLIFSKYHIFVYGLLCLLITMLIIYYINKDKIENNKLFGIIWLFIGIILSYTMTARPHMISNIFLLITGYLCIDLFNNKVSKKIYYLPIISLLWANIHGGSSNLVYLIPIMFLVIGLFKFKFTKIEADRLSKNQIIRYLIVIIISILCININPHGFKMLYYPYENMLNTTMISTISEWRPTVLSDNSHLIYFMLVFIILSILILSKKKIRFIDGVLFLFCLFLGLKSVRFWSYTYILMSLVIFDYIPHRKEDKGTDLVIICVSLILLFIFGYSFNKNIMISTTKGELSDKFINIIKKENPQRLFNSYGVGGELIYNDIEVFIDGRADLYSKYNYSDSFSISYIDGDFYKKLKKYNFDYFLINKHEDIYYYLEKDKSYKLIYKENDYCLYKKRS